MQFNTPSHTIKFAEAPVHESETRPAHPTGRKVPVSPGSLTSPASQGGRPPCDRSEQFSALANGLRNISPATPVFSLSSGSPVIRSSPVPAKIELRNTLIKDEGTIGYED